MNTYEVDGDWMTEMDMEDIKPYNLPETIHPVGFIDIYQGYCENKRETITRNISKSLILLIILL